MGYTTIGQVLPELVTSLGNRQDILQPGPIIAPATLAAPSRAELWIQQSYNEFAMNYCQAELEATVQDQFTPQNDTYPYQDGWRGVKLVTLNFNAPVTNPPSATYQQTWEVKRKSIGIIRRYSTSAPGPPAVYAPFARTIIVRPVPDQTYVFTWDVWLKPTFVVNESTGDIKATQLQVPDDWLELLTDAAIMRGHKALLERDKAQEMHNYLYGDPDPEKARKAPGAIKSKMTQGQSEIFNQEYAIQPRVRPITAGGR